MRLFTRGDMDGLTSAVFITIAEDISEIEFAHPNDVQQGLVAMTEDDIVVNLPYVKDCGLWFDHHVSEVRKLADIGKFKGRFEVAPSCARVIYNYYQNPEFDRFTDLLAATDRVDSGQLTVEDVVSPQGWVLLAFNLDPRSGFGPEFQDYFRWLIEAIKKEPLAEIMKYRQVRERCECLLSEQRSYESILKKHSRLEQNVVITDLREVDMQVVGNRFLIYTLFPAANVQVRIFKGKTGNTVVAIGHSIFNRTCNVNIGEMLSGFNGGGHQGAGTCQLDYKVVESALAEILEILKQNKK